MPADPTPYTVRMRPDQTLAGVLPAPGLDTSMVVIGYRAVFATVPAPGTPVAGFDAIDTAAVVSSTAAPVVLVAVEHATPVVTIDSGGERQIRWEHDAFGIHGGPPISWRLLPVHPGPDGRFHIAAGRWTASGYHALLTRSLARHAPTAPAAVAVHDLDLTTGARRRWP
ncbi:hypothetical protein NDR87_13625 [Nocardia sp. CDC159]|uniref:Uncharacterized protein n=1 Tax=Nocardia pulmonis TaxID=2951408 RepID=A0A9X2IZ37_9NOCA|nr:MULTISPECIES: hypothetical protein [Nocardia]MCM6774536.1 hypothetical protein [Nocardia pulmonis]MCM6787398.1 hypothetical protein [Nocardia sp. CDC159]